jgi:polyphenol oxidase
MSGSMHWAHAFDGSRIFGRDAGTVTGMATGTHTADRPEATAAPYVEIDDFAPFGVRALVSTRSAGDLALNGTAPIGEVLARWEALRTALGAAGDGSRFATATQVHGARVIQYRPGWTGWLRADGGDGHFAEEPGTGFGITIADCVPVFIAHPTRAIALVHAGWRGTAAGILRVAVAAFAARGLAAVDLRVHLGPAICSRCYEVGPEVYAQLTGTRPDRPRTVDLRAILAKQAADAGIRSVTASPSCTRCDNGLFFSHRAGDSGRQVAAIIGQRVTG